MWRKVCLGLKEKEEDSYRVIVITRVKLLFLDDAKFEQNSGYLWRIKKEWKNKRQEI